MNNQSTIDVFFKILDDGKEVEIRRYFYLKWENKFTPVCEATWEKNRPKKINFIHHVNCDYIKKGFYFYICGYFNDYEDDEFNIYKETKYKNESLLKSHLQKNIRKKDFNRAIPTALHLMKLNMNEFLRRMIIIHIEDTFLHESLNTLIWLMVAFSTKKFKMKKYIYEWLLGFVYITCSTIKIDNYNKKLKFSNNKEFKTIYDELNNYEKINIDNEKISILYSLNIRIAYGGMDCDKRMIKKCIDLWKNRFSNKDNKVKINTMRIKPINIYVSELELDNWDYSAIDYHTNNNFTDFIMKKYSYINDSEDLKKIIWYNSSGINFRKNNIKYKEEIWEDIKQYVNKTQKYLLETNY